MDSNKKLIPKGVDVTELTTDEQKLTLFQAITVMSSLAIESLICKVYLDLYYSEKAVDSCEHRYHNTSQSAARRVC